MRHTAVLKFASARRVEARQIRPNQLLVSGGSIHSGSCIQRTEQRRRGGEVTLIVTLMPANGHCSGEFFSVVNIDPKTDVVKLGVPESADPNELGIIWRKSGR
jgi:hypothetical protein